MSSWITTRVGVLLMSSHTKGRCRCVIDEVLDHNKGMCVIDEFLDHKGRCVIEFLDHNKGRCAIEEFLDHNKGTL